MKKEHDKKGRCGCEKSGAILAHPHIVGLDIHNAMCRDVLNTVVWNKLQDCIPAFFYEHGTLLF
jgi:hypothetical protein